MDERSASGPAIRVPDAGFAPRLATGGTPEFQTNQPHFRTLMETMKRILVNGAGGFIGGHLVKRLKGEGHWVRAGGIKRHEIAGTPADEFIQGGLREPHL